MSHPVAAIVAGAAAAFSLTLAIMGIRAYLRSEDRRLLWVAGAFGVFTAKHIVVTAEMVILTIGHETTEMISAFMDLAALALLVAPFIRR